MEIGQKILDDLPKTVKGLEMIADEDKVESTSIGFAGLTIERVYRTGDQQLRVAIGNNAGKHIDYINTLGNNNDRNVYIGSNAGDSDVEASNNVYIGYEAGGGDYDITDNTTTPEIKSGNVFIGYQAGLNESNSNRLYIANSSANQNNALIFGNFGNRKSRKRPGIVMFAKDGTEIYWGAFDGNLGSYTQFVGFVPSQEHAVIVSETSQVLIAHARFGGFKVWCNDNCLVVPEGTGINVVEAIPCELRIAHKHLFPVPFWPLFNLWIPGCIHDGSAHRDALFRGHIKDSLHACVWVVRFSLLDTQCGKASQHLGIKQFSRLMLDDIV